MSQDHVPELDMDLNPDLSLQSFMDMAGVITLVSLGVARVARYRNSTYFIEV